MHDVDPIALALIQNRLDHVCQQMGRVMIRTARSPIFSQAHDFSCFLTDTKGHLISQADGIPIHTGGGGFAVRALLEAFKDEGIEEGDVFVLSDPYAAGGNHLPDWVIARPIFAAGARFGFACNRAHQSDIGGGAAGTYNPEATEIFHEGLRLPPLKLMERGKLRDDLWRLLLLNSRTPDLMDGDLRAMLGSTRIGMERTAALAPDYGGEQVLDYFTSILDHAEFRFSQAISALPDGVYYGADRSDTDCFKEVEVWVRVCLTVDGDELTFDFEGSDDQIAGFKNSSLANTHSAVYTALCSFFDPNLPRNEGAFRKVHLKLPEGSVVNAKPPAPLTMCTVFPAQEIIHACWQALGQAKPDDACAGWAKNIFGITSGTAETSDEPFVMYHNNLAAGGGAVAGRDGFNQIGHLGTLGGLTIPDLEVYEQIYPVVFRQQEFRCDAAGAGKWRGGSGVQYEVEIEVPALYSFRGEGLRTPSGYGINGGENGDIGSMTLTEVGGGTESPPQYGLWRRGPLTYRASSPGGGGWGDPLDRDPTVVLRDIRDGLVSRDEAEVRYGVILENAGCAVDEASTHQRRAELRSSRKT